MDVTKHNFAEALVAFKNALIGAHFVAIDLEFSGLDTALPGSKPSAYDTSQTRYAKVAESASAFVPLQYGICVFKPDTASATADGQSDLSAYAAHPFNFNVCPESVHFDRRWMVQSSSFQFLADHGFDFNKCFRDGITWLSRDEEAHLRGRGHGAPRNTADSADRFSGKAKSAGSAAVHERPDAVPSEKDQLWLDTDVVPAISSWMEDSTGRTTPLILPPFNSYQRMLVYQTVRRMFPDVRAESEPGSNKSRGVISLRFVGGDGDAQKAAEADFNKRREGLLMALVGFRQVLDAVSDAHVPVVGHSCFQDLMLSTHSFVRPLPAQLKEWRPTVMELFPGGVCDTQRVSALAPFQGRLRGRALEHLAKQLHAWSPSVRIVLPDSTSTFARYASAAPECGVAVADDSAPQLAAAALPSASAATAGSSSAGQPPAPPASMLHEAGFDAMITGACLIRMVAIRGACTPDTVDELLGPVQPRKGAQTRSTLQTPDPSASASAAATPDSIGSKRKLLTSPPPPPVVAEGATGSTPASSTAASTPARLTPQELAAQGMAKAVAALEASKRAALLQEDQVRLLPVTKSSLADGAGDNSWPGARALPGVADSTAAATPPSTRPPNPSLMGVAALHDSLQPMHLEGKLAEPDTSNVFAVCNLNPSITTDFVLSLFSQFPRTGKLRWLSESTCLVTMFDRTLVSEATAYFDSKGNSFPPPSAPSTPSASSAAASVTTSSAPSSASNISVYPYDVWLRDHCKDQSLIDTFAFVPRNSRGVRPLPSTTASSGPSSTEASITSEPPLKKPRAD